MKKYALLVIKGIIGLLPVALKNKLKKNARLTEFYSRSLQRSGLFYGFPNKKKRKVLYRNYLSYQSAQLAKQNFQNPSNHGFDLIVFGEESVARTIESANKTKGINTIHVVGTLGDTQELVQYSPVYQYDSVRSAVSAVKQGNAVLLVNSGDRVHPQIFDILLHKSDSYDIAYCDTDFFDQHGQLSEPEFYPDWNPDLQFSTGYIKTGVLLSDSLVVGLIDESERLDSVNSIGQLVTRLWLQGFVATIEHVSHTLVHRQASNSAVASSNLQQIGRELKQLSGVQVDTQVRNGINQVLWSTRNEPLVSLIIPTKDAWELVRDCVESILAKTQYQNYEILIIDNGSTEEASLRYFTRLEQNERIRVLKYPGPFNYSAINNFGVRNAQGSVIGLINNDIEVISPGWLNHMVGYVCREDIGCVGAKLLYSDGRVQHAGVVLGYGGGAGHAHKYFPRTHPGYLNRLASSNNYSAVTAACLIVKRSIFEEVGGLNETELTVAFNDVDFCLRVKALGLYNVYCAEAELYHHESLSRGLDIAPEKALRFQRELNYLQTTWHDIIQNDPAYSLNLTLKRENFAIKQPDEF